MKMTHHRDWDESDLSGFAGAGTNSRMYTADDGEAMAIADPDDNPGKLIIVEYWPPQDTEDEQMSVQFFCPNWDVVEFMLETLLDG